VAWTLQSAKAVDHSPVPAPLCDGTSPATMNKHASIDLQDVASTVASLERPGSAMAEARTPGCSADLLATHRACSPASPRTALPGVDDRADPAGSAAAVQTRLPSIDVVVIGWQGMADRCRRIAAQVDQMPGVSLRVIYSNAAETPERGPGLWQQVPDTKYFGLKFAEALAGCASDVLLIVQGDAVFADWPLIVERCRSRFGQRPRLGLWAPRIDYTPWTPERVDIRPLAGEGLTAVAQTDGVVLAFSGAVMDRLRQLDYACNNLGWGIDWIAICHCYVHGLEVLREDGQTIMHPPSRGYGWRDAVLQCRRFMGQMTDREQTMFQILLRHTAERRRGVVGKISAMLARRRARARAARLECDLAQRAPWRPV
jgi:hypothetical protein